MFDQLFRQHAAVQRHLNSPLLPERLEYLRYCAKQGYRLSTLRPLASDLLLIQNLLGLAISAESMSVETVEAAVDQHVYRRLGQRNHKNSQRREYLLSCAIHWLRFLKRLRLPSVTLPTYQPLKEDFVDYLRVQKGLSEETLRTRCGSVEDFLQWFFRNHGSLHELTITDLDEAIARKGQDHGYARQSIRRYASDLRTFVRYAESRGWCSRGLAACIVSPRVYRGESLPRGLFWNDVQRLIAATDGDRPLDVRDRAILLLLAVYALRSIEVRTLKLDDMDWQRNLLFIPRSKGRRTEPYPLSPTVGEAIVRYLERGRPRSSYREIFLTVTAPVRPLGDGTVSRMIARRARSLKPPVVPHGAHALRHACATHLLEQGLSLKEIGDHLGHRNPDTTTIYAPVNLTGLRKVANLSLEGLL